MMKAMSKISDNNLLRFDCNIFTTSMRVLFMLVLIIVGGTSLNAQVTVNSSDSSLGEASVSTSNSVSTLTATPYSLNGAFIGWSTDGTEDGIVSKDNPYSVTSTSGTYTAMFSRIRTENGGAYYRLYCPKSASYYTFVGTEYIFDPWKSTLSWRGASFDGSVKMDATNVETDPGKIIYVSGTDNGNGLTKTQLSCQGVSLSDFDDFKNYSFTTSKVDNQNLYTIYFKYFIWNIYLKGAGGYTTNDQWAVACSGDDGANEYIRFDPITEETMDTYYFGAAPSSTMVDSNGKYWTSLYTAFPYKLEDGVKAYYVSGFNDEGSAILTEISEKVPAKTAVLLECNGTTPKENRLVPLTEDVDAITTNYLKGCIQLNDDTDPETYSQSTMRVFNKGTKGIGFYKMTEGKELTSNKVYLDISSLGSAVSSKIGFVFGEATGINEITTPEQSQTDPRLLDDNYYDLTGRKVENPQRGIYIHRGKKVIIQ